MAKRKKNATITSQANTRETAEAYVRKVFTNAKQKVVFDRDSTREPELTEALKTLGVAFTIGDMPYQTAQGGITYKHTLSVKDTEALQAIIDVKDDDAVNE